MESTIKLRSTIAQEQDVDKTVKFNALVAELVDALVLGTSGQPWGFESLLAHQKFISR